MECKWTKQKNRRAYKTELIDTLWNVNTADQVFIYSVDQELIDTLWNVNNISEETLVGTITELIDTLWNVNSWWWI